MADNTVYLITGANRGIGLALTTLLLLRPKTTVIATSRSLPLPLPSSSDATPSPSPSPYASLSIHPTSALHPIPLDESNPSISSSALPAVLSSLGIKHINILIANAGSSVGFKSVQDTDIDNFRQDLEVNFLNVVKLFGVVWPLLERAETEKKLIVMSSSVGSIGLMGLEGGGDGNLPVGSYGVSKAAVNWWAQKLSVEYKNKGLLVGVIHPGWVKTSMGQGLADAVGVKEPPLTTEESAKGVLEQIDGLTEEKTNQFLMYDGRVLPW
ncbi:NAD(P)-binding Rossmann-fold containing protein [Cladorrhinum sp. PSN332]|nr:NAD(P)-binding Rossmann-fold containing protein [Cladorrhinum sp. PSN332]